MIRHEIEPLDAYSFAPGTRVLLPSGATGVVLGVIGSESKRAPGERLRIKYDDGSGMVQLFPKYVRVYHGRISKKSRK